MYNVFNAHRSAPPTFVIHVAQVMAMGARRNFSRGGKTTNAQKRRSFFVSLEALTRFFCIFRDVLNQIEGMYSERRRREQMV